MKNIEKLKVKVQALLNKTPENGATLEEASSALAKAQQMMRDHMISESDLDDPYLGQKCILHREPLVRSAYKLDGFYNALGMVFDVETFYQKQSKYVGHICFFGFQEDIDLAVYFYKLITASALKAKDDFMYTDEAMELKKEYRSRTIMSDFVKGFIFTISQRLRAMYEERESERNENRAYGIVLAKKQDKVKDQFPSLGINIRQVKNRVTVRTNAVDNGKVAGAKMSLTQGVNGSKPNTKRIG